MSFRLTTIFTVLSLVTIAAPGCGDDDASGGAGAGGAEGGAGGAAGGGGGGTGPIDAPDDAWTFVEFPGALCMNGESTGIGINPHPTSDDVLIFMMGGNAGLHG